MGGLGPGIGASELFVIGAIALLVVGPKDLPVLMRKVGQWMARARSMAAEFRASFDEMARQSELEELRKEVEALKTANPVHRLGAEANAAFKDISDGLNAPPSPTTPQPPVASALAAPDAASVDPAPAPEARPSAVTPKPETRKSAGSNKAAAQSKSATTATKAKTTPEARKNTAPAKKAPPKRTKKVEL